MELSLLALQYQLNMIGRTYLIRWTQRPYQDGKMFLFLEQESEGGAKTSKASRYVNQTRSELLQDYMSTAFKSRKG